MYLSAVICGRVTRIERKTSRNGNDYTAITIPYQRHSDADTEWITVEVFGRQQETVQSWSTGDIVICSGPMIVSRWTTDDGHERCRLKVYGNSIRRVRKADAPQRPVTEEHHGDDDDDIPF